MNTQFFDVHPHPNHEDWLASYPHLHAIIAVSKTFDLDAIAQVHARGYRHFGENKAQELKHKAMSNTLPITWHFIGRIQSNKIKDIVRYADWIHSVDSLRTLLAIEAEAVKQNRNPKLLVQVNFTTEAHKAGCRPDDLTQLFDVAQSLKNSQLIGLMVLGPNTDQAEAIETVFAHAETTFKNLAHTYQQVHALSMGMSDDFDIAARHHATLFRIGRRLFGERSLG